MSLDRISKDSGPTASATKCLMGRSLSGAFRFRPCLAVKNGVLCRCLRVGIWLKLVTVVSLTNLRCPLLQILPAHLQQVFSSASFSSSICSHRVLRSSSPSRDRCDGGSYIARQFGVVSQHYICPSIFYTIFGDRILGRVQKSVQRQSQLDTSNAQFYCSKQFNTT